ncbi:MAG: GatB/YqeY domain-containing protein [Gammaproteobacteria bacterium]|nr:GatB/YqeY domain-containing protein [Gammaproteobacteria bacterium]MDH4253227.1 GatB/YqeY domain-containing protein [Gammaproteobacteria bacterium]MDH5308994.1 GatB/YqeY domain-containing protein [Gammaproteobacteria bacterium]
MLMPLKGQIQEDMKTAMKSGQKDRLKVIRLLLAAIKQVEVDQRKDLTDADVLGVINKMIKQRRDSIDQFQKGGREDLAAGEQQEIEVLETYLPEQMSDAELDGLVEKAVAETGAQGMRDMGKVMAILKAKAEGRADMSALSAKVKARLA